MTAPRKSMEPYLKDEVDFYEHQIIGVRKLARLSSFILADEMGLGKSLSALTVFIIDIVLGWSSTCIVVCPVTLKGNWADEIDKFTRLQYVVLGVTEINGKVKTLTPRERSKQLQEFKTMPGPKILIVNYEQVQPHLDELNSINWDIKICDEAHYLKNPKAKRTKAVIKLRSRRSFMLTGTPMLNQVNELWTLLHMISPAAYPSYWAFVNKFCVFGGFKDKQIIGVKNERQLHAKLDEIMLRRLKKDWLNLKEPQYIERRVDLSHEQQELYDEVINDMRLSTESGSQDIENALTKFLRLKQICATTLPFTGIDKSNKLDQVVEDIEELLKEGNTHIVVFTQFRDVIVALERRLSGVAPLYQLHGDIAKEARQPTINKWSAEPTGINLCMLQIAGIGLNMVRAKHALFVDELFVPGLNKQAVDRIHRIGQDETQAVQVYRYITRRTIENRIQQILKSKTKTFDSVVEEGNSDWRRKLVQAVMNGD